MGLVDVSELMLEPDFVDAIQIVRRTADVNTYGENCVKEQGFASYGCVQPADNKTIQRLPDAMRVVGLMSFWIQGQIVSDGRCKYPDIIVFRGQRYEVQTVADWQAFGPEWCEGTCVRQRAAL